MLVNGNYIHRLDGRASFANIATPVEVERRWFVERPGGGTEDVGAHVITFCPSGALIFTDKKNDLVIAYASGQWVTAEYQNDEEEDAGL